MIIIMVVAIINLLLYGTLLIFAHSSAYDGNGKLIGTILLSPTIILAILNIVWIVRF